MNSPNNNTANPSASPPVIFMVGQTASGKTYAALKAANEHPLEIINADSRQVYRGLDIGTAKPTIEQMRKVKHHLVDVAEPDEQYNLALFLDQARKAIDDVLSKGKTPVVVGGTGQYIWALVDGLHVPSVAPQRALRARLYNEAAKDGPGSLHKALQAIDPNSACYIDPRNTRRLVRALELWEMTGQRPSSLRRRSSPFFTPYIYGLKVPRKEIHFRIDERIVQMIGRGWIDEVRRLLSEGYEPTLPSFSSAGYRELADHVIGNYSRDEALDLIKFSVRRLAKRQTTWFKQDDPRITWLDRPGDFTETIGRLCYSSMVQSGPKQEIF